MEATNFWRMFRSKHIFKSKKLCLFPVSKPLGEACLLGVGGVMCLGGVYGLLVLIHSKLEWIRVSKTIKPGSFL